MRQFAISDIHGCAATFRHATQHVLRLAAGDSLFLLGDFVDRGPDSKGVIDHIFGLQADGVAVQCLRGNHEQIMLSALYSEDSLALWLKNGGDATLASFGATNIRDIPAKYLSFFRDLRFYIPLEKYFLVHAGLDFSQTDPLLNREAMLWIRGDWKNALDRTWLAGRVIVHGHTPLVRRDIEAQLIGLLPDKSATPVLCIDGGCVYGPPRGQLCVLDLDARSFLFIANLD